MLVSTRRPQLRMAAWAQVARALLVAAEPGASLATICPQRTSAAALAVAARAPPAAVAILARVAHRKRLHLARVLLATLLLQRRRVAAWVPLARASPRTVARAACVRADLRSRPSAHATPAMFRHPRRRPRVQAALAAALPVVPAAVAVAMAPRQWRVHAQLGTHRPRRRQARVLAAPAHA